MVLSMIPAAGAAEATTMEEGFLLPISAELPQKQSSGLMVQDEDLVLPDPHGSGFIGELSAPMPVIRDDGFLAEPSAPLKAFPESGTLMDAFEEYDKEDETIIPISTAEDLAGMVAEGKYVLTADIDLSETFWIPLSIDGPITLDGQGHKISGLTYALFDSTQDLTVRNLIIFEPTLELERQCGILANTVSGSLQVENCVLENFTTNSYNVWLTDMGGMVGAVTGEGNTVSFQSCAVSGSLTYSFNANMGGLVASVSAASARFTDCVTDISLSSPTSASTASCGGLVGVLDLDLSATFLRCTSSAVISASTSTTGGFVGSMTGNAAITVADSLFSGTLIDAHGGMFGIVNCPSAVFLNCRSEGTISKLSNREGFGGFVGAFSDTVSAAVSFSNCLAATNFALTIPGESPSSSSRSKPDLYLGGLVGKGPVSFAATGCLSTGDVKQQEHSYARGHVGGMVGFLPENSICTLLQCENRADMSGILVGGLVGSAAQVEFTDCKNSGNISNCEASSARYANTSGGLVATANGTMTNCVNSGPVTGAEAAGGLLGSGCVSFTDCRGSGMISNATAYNSIYLGGLAGKANNPSSFENCASDATLCVTAVGTYITPMLGGLAGELEGWIERCCAAPTISFASGVPSSPYLGGLAGRSKTFLGIADSSAVLNYTGIGYSAAFIGGLLGTGAAVNADNCTATVNIASATTKNSYSDETGDRLGGLIGGCSGASSLTRCYTLGTINALPADCGQPKSDAGGLVGYLGKAPLVIGQCWSDVSIKDACRMGGLVGGSDSSYSSTATINMYSSWSSGTISYRTGMTYPSPGSFTVMGGLIGYGANINMQDCCFLGELDCANTYQAGGLVGCGNSYLFNCYTEADVISRGGGQCVASYLGGLVGYGEGTIDSCRYSGSVSGYGTLNIDPVVGGITGYGDTVQNCEVDGSVYGQTAGSIMGKGSAAYYCISTGEVKPCAGCSSDHYHYLGGIAGRADDIYGCTVAQPLMFSVDGDGSTDLFAGGIVGYGSSVANCVSKGVHVVSYGNSILYVGGIAGTGEEFQSCRVEGSVYARSTGETTSEEQLNIGGIAGYGSSITAAGCTVTGDVNGYLIPLKNKTGKSYIFLGGTVGRCSTLTLESSNQFGSRNHSVSSAVTVETKYPQLGLGSLKLAPVPPISSPERDAEEYTIVVWAQEGLNFIPKQDVRIYANGAYAGTTDENGELVLTSQTVSSKSTVWLYINEDGYFELKIPTFLADGGKTGLVLRPKNPGEIYFASALLTDTDNSTHDVLSPLTNVRIPQQDTEYRHLRVDVDWNDLDEENRELKITNAQENKIVTLSDEQTESIRFSKLFDANEPIYVKASGTYNGNPVEKKQLLSVSVRPIAVHLPTKEADQQVGGEKDSDKGLYFAKDLKINLNFGALEKLASSISYNGNVLTLKMSKGDQDKKKIGVWGGFSEKVSLEGSVSIPLSDIYEGEWSGEVKASINQGVSSNVSNKETKKENKKLDDDKKVTYPFNIAGVPCFLETGLSAGGSATLGAHGPWNKAYATGDITANGNFTIFGGIGGSLGTDLDIKLSESKKISGDVELKFGGQGTAGVKLPMGFDMKTDSITYFDPSISGTLSAKVSAKAFFLSVQKELKLGGFNWNKEGVTWTLGDEDITDDLKPAAFSLTRANTSFAWVAMNRDYLKNGGGFLPYDAATFAFNPASGQTLRYENISALAETALGTENAQPVLYYTADDGSASGGDITNHTALWRAVRNGDGSWSSAVLSGGETGYPASPNASNSGVIWVESDEMSSLDDMLSSTKIKAALSGNSIHTFETNGYVYAPKISVSTDGSSALACWLGDLTVTGDNLLGTDTRVYTASFANGVWSDVSEVVTAEVPVRAVPDVRSGKITYLTASGNVYQGTTNLASITDGSVAMAGAVTAVFDSKDRLTLLSSGSPVAELSTGYTGTQPPVFLYTDSGSYYLFWPEERGICMTTSEYGYSWSEPVLVVGTELIPREIVATMVDGEPFLSYTLTQNAGSENEQTDLYTVQVPVNAADLVVTELRYEVADTAALGYLTLQADVFNNGLAETTSCEITVTNEAGDVVYTHTRDMVLACGESTTIPIAFAPDPDAAQDYTVQISPAETDADPSDNSLSIFIGEASAKLVSASFLDLPDGVQLQALVQNTGALTLSDVAVEITTLGGDPVVSQTYSGENAIPTGSIRQVLVNNPQPNVFYKVCVVHNGTVLDSDMLMYEDPDAQILTVSSISIDDDSAQLTLFGQNQNISSSKIILALYNDTRMVAAGSGDVSALNGSQTLTLSLSKAPASGSYNYKVFFLSDNETFAPISNPASGTVRIP